MSLALSYDGMGRAPLVEAIRCALPDEAKFFFFFQACFAENIMTGKIEVSGRAAHIIVPSWISQFSIFVLFCIILKGDVSATTLKHLATFQCLSGKKAKKRYFPARNYIKITKGKMSMLPKPYILSIND